MVKKRKKTVLKISTGHKALPYRNDKNGKTQKSFQKGDAQAKSTMNGIAKKKILGPIRHTSFLSPSMLRGLFCQIIMTKVSEGHQVYN